MMALFCGSQNDIFQCKESGKHWTTFTFIVWTKNNDAAEIYSNTMRKTVCQQKNSIQKETG